MYKNTQSSFTFLLTWGGKNFFRERFARGRLGAQGKIKFAYTCSDYSAANLSYVGSSLNRVFTFFGKMINQQNRLKYTVKNYDDILFSFL